MVSSEEFVAASERGCSVRLSLVGWTATRVANTFEGIAVRNLLQAVFLLVGLSLAITPEIGATVQDPVRVEQGQLYGAATKWSVAQLRRHSAADASRLAALLVG
jgi:hypothetical protein